MNPHLDQPVLTAGAPLEGCRAAALLVHGRGRDPAEMIALAEGFGVPGVAYLVPAAAERTWYPYSFLEPLGRNQPLLDYALEAYLARVAALHAAGVPLRKIVLMGFSQGACLTVEYAARHAGRYGGVVAFTGGLIGPQGTVWERCGDFGGAPVLIGGAERDAWVPAWRMGESAEHFRQMGAQVSTLFYAGDSHVVSDDEIAAARAILRAAAEAA
ncbi:MAG TPA: dienelactone hydrolase family protein [Chloroflexaceae bacterium]|nr:dienelactone hydrolase family protein [Chloroflexaceae bacterium]